MDLFKGKPKVMPLATRPQQQAIDEAVNQQAKREARYWIEVSEPQASPIPSLEPYPDTLEATHEEHLWVLRKIGIQIRNWFPRNIEAWQRWEAHYTEWLLRLEQALRAQQRVALWRYIEVLNDISGFNPQGAKFYSAQHQLLASCLHAQLQRLEARLVTDVR